MKTVTICGSMRFAKEMQRIAFLLEVRHHFNVLQCVYDPEGYTLTPQDIEALNAAHNRKIELADAVYIVDLQGYIGSQTAREIDYAKSLGKEVLFHSRFFPMEFC